MLPRADPTSPDWLPVRTVLDELTAAVADGPVVLVAPPGTGKTTLVPLALADARGGRIVVAQPRRVAARAAARRMASLVGGAVGELVGFSVRGESRVSGRTRVEVVTTGLLVRRLQHDPELAGTSAVMVDECHERHLDTDLALAFLADVRATLRPDLALVAASATVDARRFATTIGGEAPATVVSADGALFPVEVVWCPPTVAVRPSYGLQVDRRFVDHVVGIAHRALGETSGDVLVFLPGVGEVNTVASRLAARAPAVDVLTLHGRQSAIQQDAALTGGVRRRVVVATSVAESSLTVPGVRVVVDAGLSREPRTDHARGLGTLVTVRAAQATATQRAGRAGRQGPGRVYRCWAEAEHERRPDHAQPEIAIADLTGFALQLACWGHPNGVGLALPDRPPPAAMTVARTTLAGLGAVDADGRVTLRGRSIAAVGAHPRLARAYLDGARLVGADRAAQLVAILADDGPTGGGDDLVAQWRRLRGGTDRAATARWRDEVRRLGAVPPTAIADPTRTDLLAGATARADVDAARLTDDLAAGLVVALAYPERVAKARSPGARTYLMAGGTAAELDATSGLTGLEWLAVAVADRAPGSAAARIRLAAVIDETTAVQAAWALRQPADEVRWHDGDVIARRVVRLGAIVLSDAPLPRPDPDLVADAVAAGVRAEGLSVLTWGREAVALRDRLAFCRFALGEPWPAVDDASLLRELPRWLGPDLAGARRRADLSRIDVVRALRRLLGWREAARLDEVAPERLAVPSGSRIRVDYSDQEAPVLAVKLQETFGWASAPRIADGRVAVVLHLLSPAGRPAAITSDLPSFWRNGYPQVRAELRGRYPRHAWPDDPTTAPPARGRG